MKKVLFPNLNAVRFFAAFIVIWGHIPAFMNSFNMNLKPFPKLISGHYGVIAFFVLSGFLITYLLLQERHDTSKISIKDFYLRRILRIWPLYYLIIILALFILPNIQIFQTPSSSIVYENDFISKIMLFIFFLPNLALILFQAVPYASQSWSIGVEEQFYLIWPILVKKSKNVLTTLFIVLIVYYFLRICFFFICKYIPDNLIITNINGFIETLRVDCFAFGGIAANILFFKRTKILNILFNWKVQILIYLFTFLLVSRVLKIGDKVDYSLEAFLFSIIILNLASNPKTIVKLNFKIFDYLGKVSYGLYMYHSIVIVLVIQLAVYLNYKNSLFIYLFSIIFTIIISALSYELFEKYFISKKKRFSVIISGENAKKQ